MAAFNYAPTPLQDTFFIPGSNTPGNGVLLFTYLAGSTTKTPVYMDSGGLAAHTNPIVLDSGGNLPSGSVIWIPTGVTLKAVYAPANDTDPPTSPYRTIDNIVGINDTESDVSEWTSGPTPTFISTTSFSVVGDQTAIFTKYRRLRTTNTGGTIYSTITASSFGGGITTVTVQNDSGALDSGLSAVAYGILNPANPSLSQGEWIVIPKTTVANTSFAAFPISSAVMLTHELVITDYKPVSNVAGVLLQLSGDGGATWFSTAVYRTERLQIANATSAALGTTDVGGVLAGSSATSAALPFTAKLDFMNMRDVSRFKVVDFYVGYEDVGNIFVVNRGAVYGVISVSSINAARIMPTSGNISTMTYELFGRRDL